MSKYEMIRKQFELNKNDEDSVHMEAYMRNKFKFYGLPT